LGKAFAYYALIYGGAKVGLMGAVARAVHEHGGKVVGVTPKRSGIRESPIYRERFAKPDYRQLCHVAANAPDLFEYLEGYQPPGLQSKWF